MDHSKENKERYKGPGRQWQSLWLMTQWSWRRRGGYGRASHDIVLLTDNSQKPSGLPLDSFMWCGPLCLLFLLICNSHLPVAGEAVHPIAYKRFKMARDCCVVQLLTSGNVGHASFCHSARQHYRPGRPRTCGAPRNL